MAKGCGPGARLGTSAPIKTSEMQITMDEFVARFEQTLRTKVALGNDRLIPAFRMRLMIFRDDDPSHHGARERAGSAAV